MRISAIHVYSLDLPLSGAGYTFAKGKALKEVGPATFAKVVAFKGKQVVTLTSSTTDKRGGNNFTITAYRTTDFRKAAGSRVYVQADLMLKKPPIRLLY